MTKEKKNFLKKTPSHLIPKNRKDTLIFGIVAPNTYLCNIQLAPGSMVRSPCLSAKIHKTIVMPEQPISQQRHRNMAAIHSKDTKPELVVRRYLWRHGFRYRLNHPRLPGRPDVVLRKYRTCIFVNGCFWHGHHITASAGKVPRSSSCCKIPKTRTDFWVSKIVRNQARDRDVQHKLAAMGWHSITVWECELQPHRREQTLASLAFTLNSIFLRDHSIRPYTLPEEQSAWAADNTIDGYRDE